MTGPEFGQELDFSGVFRWSENGNVDLLVRDLEGPNGIAFSRDETMLYVSNGRSVRQWWVYQVNRDGTVGAGRVLFEMPRDESPGGPDGMKVDTRGNLWASGPGGVLVLSPDGRHLGTIRTPEAASNCAFGDADGRTLYITARTGIYKIRLSVEGW
jgi:gluconolactonase